MPQYIPLPNGAYFELQEGERPEVGLRRAQAKYPEAFAAPASAPAAKPESGFIPALRAGATELGGGISALMGKVGLKDEAKAEAEYQAAKKRAAEIFKPTEEGWTEAPVTKLKELLGGSLPYIALPAAAGAAALALPATVAATPVLGGLTTLGTAAGLGAAGLTSAGQFTATNLARQMEGEEGAMPKKSLGETSLPSAMAAAVPQALLDTLSMRMIPGIGRIFGQAGVKITAENAKEIAEQGLKKTLADYALKTGKTAGVEGATEAAQQVFERLQAGLNITDGKARDEYFESFLGGAVLGGTLAPAGRFVERGREQREARGLLEGQAAEERKAALAAEEAQKKSPEYLQDLEARYQAAMQQKAKLDAAIVKPPKDADPATKIAYRDAVRARDEFAKTEMAEVAREYATRKGEIAQFKESQRVAGMTPLEYQMEQAGVDLTAPPKEERVFTGEEEITPPPETPAPAITYAANQLALANEQAFVNEMDVKDRPAAYIPYLMQDPAMAQALVTANTPIPGLKKRESNAVLSGLKLQLEALGGEMAAGREAAGVERTQAGLEQQVAREQAAQRAATQQRLEFEGTAEREAMQEAAAARASDMRARELQPLQTAQQTTLFPEGTRVETRPKGTLPERLNTLTERILAAPNVDDATKDLAQQVQDNLPQVAAQLRAQTEALAQRAPQRGVAPRVTPRGVAQGDEEAQIANWAQSVLQGRASPEMTADLRSAVQALEAGKRSETEQVTQYAGRALTAQEKQDVAGTSLEGRRGVMTREPTGEVRRAVQTEIAMPEPTAKAFESFGAFNDYLASEGLQAYRTQKGLVFPTLSNLQRRLAPIQTRVAELQKQLDDVNAKRDALQKADAAERGAASELLRESQQKLQATVKTLDETARTTYVGAKLKEVDLVELLDQAHGRLNASLAHSANLRQQFAQALGKIASAEEAAKPVMVDAKGNATTKEKAAVRTVAQGQLPGYQALRKAQLDLQAKGNALVEADQKLEQVVKAGIGQSWETGSPTLTAYLKAKKAKDEAQRAAQQAHFAVLQAYRRVPSTEALNNNLSKFLAEKSSIDTEMAKAAKSLSAIRLGVRNASNRLNDAYVRMENNPELRFGESLLRLRQDLLAAQNINEEAMGRSVERQAQAGELAKEAKGIAEPMRKQQALVRGVLEGAAERAEARRGVPAKETQADREARDADTRREEQARLERQEAIPATRIEFERAETDNQETRRLAEAVGEAPNAEARAAARKAFDEHLKALVARKDAELDDMKRRAAKNVQDLNTQRKAVAELTERLKGDLTPKRRESAEKQLAEAKRKLAEHERRYTLNTREMKIKRTDVQAQRQERNRLLAEASRRREEGERLGPRAIGPLTRDEVIPPKALRTESPESRAGLTATDSRQKLTEARGLKQRDIPMTAKEMAEAEAQAAAMKTLEGVTKAEKALDAQFKAAEERGMRPGELERFRERQEILSKRKDALRQLQAVKPAATVEAAPEQAKKLEKAEKAEAPVKKPGRKAAAIEAMEEELDAFEPEILGGPNEEVFFREAGPQYEARDLTDLTPAALEAVEDGDIRTALADLEKNGSTPFVRELAKHLGDMTMRTKLEVRNIVEQNGEQVEGLYVASKNLVQLHRGALSEETLTHELTHAATMRVLEADPKTLTPEQRAARQEIEKLHAAIEKQPDFAKEYGRKDVKEFVSELMSNRDFRNKLDAQKPNFIKRIYDAFMRLIGFPRATMSEKAVENAYKLFMPAQVLKAAPAPSARRGAPGMATANRVADQLVGQQKGWLQKLRENFLGIGGRAQFVDMRFPLEEALKKGGVEDLDAMQAMYYVRMYDQKMHFTSEAITEGVPEVVEKARKDGRTERIIEAKAGANLTQAYKILTSKEVIKEAGSADAANKLVTLYMAAIRGANKGYDKLNFGRAWATQEIKRLDSQINAKDTTPEERTNLQKRRKALDDRLDTMPTPEDIKASRAEIEANPVLREAFDKVREVYNEYNRNLLQLAVQTGAISKDHARTLLAQNDYIPYYRMRGGVAEMVIGDETPIRIGNIKDNQELQELVGGDEPILDFITSSMQNTSMLVDMSLRNIAMKNAMFELRDVGLATVAKEPKGGAPKGSVTFKKDGEDYYAVVNTDVLGISSDLLVKGLAGIPTMFPMWVRAMGVPARFLRRAIVAAPPYWAKQVFRDSLGAAMSSGADIVPVLGALRQIGKDNVLERRGITGGQVFTGLPEDKKRMLDAMQAGKVSLTRGMAWLEATAAKADALTRKNQYESYLAQGLSEMEATYMALESMNFSKRGLLPSVHYANILIPFFNSQIQGLDALYKAFTGKMPMNERLEIRQKLWTRGMLMFAMSMAYAAMMQDDEAYKNAKPDEKYGNWFVPLKNFGIDETLRLPIPFELGYIFKALPEAIVNSMMREEGAKEARDAFLHIAQQTIPGGSSLGIPAAVKPALETVLGVSSYTGRPIESAQEQMELEPGYRTRDNTTALARQIGEMTNFSPIKLEFLVRGYTGSMGMAALAALSAPLGGTGPTPATKRLTDTPIFGTLFQPKDASGIIDATYERLNKVNQLVKTHEKLLQDGRVADAEKYFAEHQDDMALGSLAGSFKQFMGEITQVERAVRSSPSLTPDQKREKLDYLRQVKIRAAESVRDSVRAASDRKTPQAVPA